MSIHQSIVWWGFARKEQNPEQLIKLIARTGFAAIELAEPRYWPMIKDYGLSIASWIGHKSIVHGLNRRENHDRIERELRVNLELAVQWGIPSLICYSGMRRDTASVNGVEIAAEGLMRVAKEAEDAGVKLIIELINSKEIYKGYECNNTKWGVSVCQMVNSPNIRVLYDIYHMQMMEGDIIQTIQKYYPFFAHYHTAGNPGRHELDETQELYYPAILRAISSTGYTGYIGHEFIPEKDIEQSLSNTFDLCNRALNRETERQIAPE